MYTLTGERLMLRRFTRADEGIHALLLTDPAVYGPFARRGLSLDETRDWLVFRELEGARDDLGFWAVVRRDGDELLGVAGLQAYVARWIVWEDEPDGRHHRVEIELSYA